MVLVIIGHYFKYRLFLNDVTDIVKSVPIMSFLVMIIIIEKMLIYIERIRNQKMDIILDQYRLLLIIHLKYLSICWNIGTCKIFYRCITN